MAQPKTQQARARGRPTLESSAALRENLLNKALDEFLTKGYAGASIEGIARAARVSRVAIYKQFVNKPTLFRACTLRAMDAALQSVGAVKDLDRAPEEVLQEIARRAYANSVSRLTMALTRIVIAEAQRFPDVAARVFADTEIVFAPVVDYLRYLHGQGRIHIDDPVEAAVMFLSLTSGGVRILMDKPLDGPALDDWLRRSVQVFLHGVAARPVPATPKTRRQPISAKVS